MKRRMLGKGGLSVSELGLGCMGMSEFYGPGDEAESLRTLDRAIALGIDFFDTTHDRRTEPATEPDARASWTALRALRS